MKKRAIILAILFVALMMTSPAMGKIIFVDADATGANDGSSWADAFNDLLDALAVAQYGDEIRVAQGVYKSTRYGFPTPGGPCPVDRTSTFQLINGVTLKGGYAGFGEAEPNARDIEENETVLSGDHNGDDGDINDPADLLDEPTRGENSYHVVTASGTDGTAVLDGFTITAGNANESVYPSNHRKGGGMFNDGGSPKVTNCTFRDNSAMYYGGGMYNGEDNSNPMVTNCTFVSNWASSGGAVYNAWKSKPMMTNCVLILNKANYGGGGMYNEHSSPILTNCSFTANSANKGNGGGLLVNCIGSSRPILNNCLFSRNSASWGGAISCIGQLPPPFPGFPPTPWRGPIITNCTIIGNTANEGAGIYNSYIVPILSNCTLRGNSAGENGGGIHNTYHANTMVTNCTFSANSAKYDGGGMANYSSNPTLTNCIFTSNSAGSGGSMYNNSSSSALANCTFAGNSAPNGNVLACDSYMHQRPSNLQLTNCILWDGGNEIWNNDASTISSTYSDIQGGWPGEGNIDADPRFVEPGYRDTNGTPNDANDDVWVDGDYHLLPDSPCIDAGDPNYVAEPNETDLDGKPRVLDGCNDGVLVVDMGAYESPIFAEVRIVPRTISLESRGKWITAFLWRPEGYAVTDIADFVSHRLLLDYEIEPERFLFNEEKQVVMARFRQEEVQNFLNVGEFVLSISLQLMDGSVFEGRDLIRVTSKRGGKPDKYVQASNPNPADGATGVDINADLSWSTSLSAISHDVYFGTSNPPPFVCNQTAITFDPGTMDYETRYYWRIDEVSKWGVTDGQPWSFTTEEGGGKPPGAPPGCFPADTPVWIDGEQVQFSKVTTGRKVGRLDATDAVSCFEKPEPLKEIESVLEYQGTDDYYNIVLENGNRINVVHSHYFLTASDQWVRVENLKAGSKLQSLNGPIPIKTIIKREVPFTGKYYNLKIKCGDRFFVGKDGVTVRGH